MKPLKGYKVLFVYDMVSNEVVDQPIPPYIRGSSPQLVPLPEISKIWKNQIESGKTEEFYVHCLHHDYNHHKKDEGAMKKRIFKPKDEILNELIDSGDFNVSILDIYKFFDGWGVGYRLDWLHDKNLPDYLRKEIQHQREEMSTTCERSTCTGFTELANFGMEKLPVEFMNRLKSMKNDTALFHEASKISDQVSNDNDDNVSVDSNDPTPDQNLVFAKHMLDENYHRKYVESDHGYESMFPPTEVRMTYRMTCVVFYPKFRDFETVLKAKRVGNSELVEAFIERHRGTAEQELISKDFERCAERFVVRRREYAGRDLKKI